MLGSIDETGNHYGRLLALKRAGKNKHGHIQWLCRCDCGEELVTLGASLRSGHTKSCGCLKRERASIVNTIDLVGQVFGRLTVIERRGSDKHHIATWLCRCSCGSKVVVRSNALRSGATRSCGCFLRESARERRLLPKGVAAFNALVGQMRRVAEAHDLEWQLTDKQVRRLTKQPCFYCGVKPSQVFGSAKYNGDYIYNGLDRVDNVRGYTIDNVVPCCKVCNYAKRNMTVKEFKFWVKRVHEHFIVKGKQCQRSLVPACTC